MPKKINIFVILATLCSLLPVNLFAMEWTQATANAGWSARACHTSVVFDNKIWVMGGAGSYKNDVWYSTNGVTWIQATANAGWSARSEYTSVVFDNKMWVMGGYDGSSLRNDVWYSSDGVTWTRATANAGWSARYGHTSVVFDNKMWVMGGAGSYKNDVWYSADGVNWTRATANAQWAARVIHTSVVFDNKMWVISGQDASGAKNDVWYSSDGVNWTQATANAQWVERVLHTSVVFDNKMWVMGGHISGSPYYKNDVWYSTNGVNWTQATANAGWAGRYAHTSVVFDNKIWVIGRYDGSLKRDVWYSRGITFTITFNHTGLNSDFTGNVLNVDDTSYVYTDLPKSFNWVSGSSHTFQYYDTLSITGKRYIWTSTSGLALTKSGTINVSDTGSVTGNYATQYYLTLATNPPGITFPTGEGWYNANTNASISTIASVVSGTITYFFSGWTTAVMGEITNPMVLSTTVIMDEPKTVTANYITLFRPTTAKSKGFWTNNNGQPLLILADAIYLNTLPPYMTFTPYPKEPAGSTPFNTTVLSNFKKQVKDYLNNANAVDMRYMLAAQLLAVELDVRHNFLSADQLVWLDNGNGIYEPGEGYTITTIMNNSITAWQTGTLTARTYWKDVCDKICNNLLWFIYGSSIWRATPTPSQTNVATMSEKTATVIPTINVSPNPFTTNARISYTLPASGNISIKLFDASGRVIETINNGYLVQGTYSANLSANTLVKGIYFLRFETQTYNNNIKLIVR